MPHIFFKIVVSLLFIFSFLDAETTQNKNLQNELNTLKLEIEKLKIIHDQSTVYKLIELESSIKVLESKIVESKVDKKGLEKEFENYQDTIERQDKRIEDVNNNINFWAIGFSLIGILTGLAVFFINKKYAKEAKEEAKSEASNAVQSWLKENKDKILQPIKNEGNKLSFEIQEQIDEFFKDAKEKLSEHDIKEELNNRDKELLTKITNSLKNKHEENYTYSDWYSLYLEEYYKQGRAHKLKALEYIDKAINSKTEPYEELKARFDKAILLGKINETQKEFNEYEYILKNYDYKEEKFERFIASSYYNKGLILTTQGKKDDAITAYTNVIEKFKNSQNKYILNTFAKSIINKIELLIFNNLEIKYEVELLKNKFSKDNTMLVEVEMLEILNNAKTSDQTKAMKLWQKKYENEKLVDWGFEEITNWVKTIEDKEVKERIEKYIAIFEEKLQNDSKN